MKIYISAPITGYDLQERKEFFAAMASLLRDLGQTPVNPMESIDVSNPPAHSEAMRRDIAMLLDCDAILLLGEWWNSEGCVVEKMVAETCGIKVIGLEYIIRKSIAETTKDEQ